MKVYDNFLEERWAGLEHKISDAGLAVDISRVRRAFEMAVDSHAGQFRKDGSPYVTHTIAAAEIIVELGLDEDSIIAALLHDTLEDTTVEYSEICKQFGETVAIIVDGVTKLTRVSYASPESDPQSDPQSEQEKREKEQAENMRKMLMAMCKDIRVILVKLADRLHNMRTMQYQSPEKQRLKSLETMQVYAPIAHRLGMQRMKWELEDLSLKYLDPVGYETILDTLDKRRNELEAFMVLMERKIRTRLEEWHIECSLSHRIKHIYSIYRKMYSQHLDLPEIFDLCALRVIVDNLSECYNTLGQIHDMFKPVPGRFKDYIATPKQNGYQSLHTTVIGSEGIPFEVQIRTWDMHRTAEYGVAAHWKYKSGESGVRKGDEKTFAWVRRLLENQQNTDSQDFISQLRMEMFGDEVFVFTPRGDVVNLPRDATPIDFAYKIHSAIGNHMVGAKVNGRIVPFNHVLSNGDIVEILTSKASTGPSRDWLQLARSGEARTKIKQWFKKEKREENIVRGREMLDSELHRAGITPAEIQEFGVFKAVLRRLSMQSLDDMYAAIGYGGLTVTSSIGRIRDELARAKKKGLVKTPLEKLQEAAERREARSKKKLRPIHGILVEDMDNCLVKFARCCTPVPGDDIVGFITRGYGVSVHRRDCPNYLKGQENPDEAGRWIPVQWAEECHDSYNTTLKICSVDRKNLVMDIAAVLGSLSARVHSLLARDVGSGRAVTTISLEVSDLHELQEIIRRLSAVSGVSEISRSST